MMSRRTTTTEVAAERAAKATVSRHIGVLWAIAVYPVMWVLGGILWLVWGRSAGLPYVSFFLGVLGLIIVWWIGQNAYKRHKGTHVMWAHYLLHTLVTLVAGLIWAVMAMIAGPLSHPLIDIFVIFGGVLTFSWVARLHYEQKDAHAHVNGQPNAKSAVRALMDARGHHGVDGQVVLNNADRTDVRLDLSDSDVLVEDVQESAVHLAKDFGEPRRNVSVIADPDREDTALLRIVHGDPLNERVLYPGPEKPGASPYEPIRTGVREDGTLARKLIITEAGPYHELSTGTTGAGKGNGARVECMELMSRRGVRQIVVDPIKGIAVFGRLAAGLDWLITDHPTAAKFVRGLPKLIKANSEYLASRGLDAWEPGCGIPLWVIWFQEASELKVSWDGLETIGKIARSGATLIKVDTQSAQHTQIPITLRRMMGAMAVYGCMDDQDESGLPEAITMSNRSPSNWGNRFPGRCYEVAPGQTHQEQVTPMRKYDAGDWEFGRRYAAEWGPRFATGPDSDPIMAQVFGALYTERKRPLQAVADAVAHANTLFSGIAAPTPLASPSPAQPDPDTDDDEDDDMDTDLGQTTQESLGVTAEDPMPEVDDEEAIDHMPMDPPAENTPLGANTPLDKQPRNLSDAEMEAAVRKRLVDRLHELHAMGEDTVTAPQFHEAIVAANLRSRPWVHKQLRKLCDAGHLTWSDETRGYEIHEPLPDKGQTLAVL